MPDQQDPAQVISTMSLDALATTINAQGTAVKTAFRGAQQNYTKDRAPELYTLYEQLQLTFDGVKKLHDSLDSVRTGVEGHQRESFLGEFRGLDHSVRRSIEETLPVLGALGGRVRFGRGADDSLKAAYAEATNFYDTLPMYLDRFNKLKEATVTLPDTGFWYTTPGIKDATRFIETRPVNKRLSYLLWTGAGLLAVPYAVSKLWGAWRHRKERGNSMVIQPTASTSPSSPSRTKNRHSFAGFCLCCIACASPLLGARYLLPKVQDYIDQQNEGERRQAAQLQTAMQRSYAPLQASILEEEKDLTRLEQLSHNAPAKERRSLVKHLNEMRGEVQKMKQTLHAAQQPVGR